MLDWRTVLKSDKSVGFLVYFAEAIEIFLWVVFNPSG